MDANSAQTIAIDDRHRRRECVRPETHRHLMQPRNAGRSDANEQRHRELREPEADRGSDRRNGQRLREHLSQQRAARCAEREADGGVALPRHGARDEDARGIERRDREDEQRHDEQRRHRRTRGAEDLVDEEQRVLLGAFVLVGPRALDLIGEHIQLRLRLFERDARLHPRDAFEHGVVARFRRRIVGRLQRQDEVRVAREVQLRRQHADDGELVALEIDRLPDDLLLRAEERRPEAMTDDRHRSRAGLMLRLGEQPPMQRAHAEERVERLRDEVRLHVHRLGRVDDDREVRGREDRHVLERLRFVADRVVIRERELEMRHALLRDVRPDRDDALLIAERERTQDDVARDGEERGRDAEAEGERDDREQRRGGLAEETFDGAHEFHSKCGAGAESGHHPALLSTQHSALHHSQSMCNATAGSRRIALRTGTHVAISAIAISSSGTAA